MDRTGGESRPVDRIANPGTAAARFPLRALLPWASRTVLAAAAAVILPACIVTNDSIVIQVTGATATTITIEWSSPGVDLMTGQVVPADGYDLRWSTSDATPFDEMSPVPGGVVPPPVLPRGTIQQAVVPGLSPGTTYYFVLRGSITDEGSLYTLDSSKVSGTTEADFVAPETVSDLAVGMATRDSMTLTWSAPGDDGMSGKVSSYDLRYATTGPITSDADFEAAVQAAVRSLPQMPGSTETCTVQNLEMSTCYWFSVRAIDDGGNQGALPAMSASAFTLGGDGISHAAGDSPCGGTVAGTASTIWIWLVAAFALRRR